MDEGRYDMIDARGSEVGAGDGVLGLLTKEEIGGAVDDGLDECDAIGWCL